ncbi:unnamed protein product [Rotaria sordida]|uniref:TIR domain-containing protein n=1 Tax=Rotaria sordida TaxID=392033 RepID=A0A815CLI3_9BILA|nr:unnamed protein product [Rotaria sordida]CAF1562412.1 unnamed protein product [Rotaria sordida]
MFEGKYKPDSEKELSKDNLSNSREFQESVVTSNNSVLFNNTKNNEVRFGEQPIYASSSSSDMNNRNQQRNENNVFKAVSGAQLSLFYGSVSSVTTEQDEDYIKDPPETEDKTHDSFESVSEEATDKLQASLTIPITTTTTNYNQPQKRHIMISYNQSSRETCQKIYDRLVERNYKVWMDLTNMVDDILVSMAQAVENSYIILICINQQYYTSDYCRLEAEYAAENRIKFIPCLMEKSFRAESWLGIIKGSNVHVDFSSVENFDHSFEELVRQITYVEKKLSLQPRRTPTPCSFMNPIQLTTMNTLDTAISTGINDTSCRRFDDIIRKYKRSLKKERCELYQLKPNELASLIIKLRQELFADPHILSDSERSDGEVGKQHNDNQYLKQTLSPTPYQNELLLSLVNRITKLETMQQNNSHYFDMYGCFKVTLGIMALWAFNVYIIKNRHIL